jgi:hypothetical protein
MNLFQLQNTLIICVAVVIPFIRTAQALSNVNFFYWPAVWQDIPSVQAGDILNVSWISSLPDDCTLVRWCQGVPGEYPMHNCQYINRLPTDNGAVATVTNLPATGFSTMTVTADWTWPCYFLLGNPGVQMDFSSGFVQQMSTETDNPISTWGASNYPTATAVVSTVTASATQTSNPAWESANASRPRRLRITPAGIGVGILIGAGIWAIVIPTYLLWRRWMRRSASVRAAKQQRRELSASESWRSQHVERAQPHPAIYLQDKVRAELPA